MTKLFFLFSLIFLFSFSCTKKVQLNPETSIDQHLVTKNGMCQQVYSLMAGQNHLAGSIIVTNDVYNMYVTYVTTNGWKLEETHLYVGDVQGIPKNQAGTPKIGHFPNAGSHNNITTYTYTIPTPPMSGCYTIAAHAVVSNSTINNMSTEFTGKLDVNQRNPGGGMQNETAWGSGTQFTPFGWATYFEYCLCPVD